MHILFTTQVIEKVDRHWVRCRMESREGLIPSSHITQVENFPKISQSQYIFKSTTDYPAQGNGQISFKKGKQSYFSNDLSVSKCFIIDHFLSLRKFYA